MGSGRAGLRKTRRSSNTLVGRVHLQALLEARHDVAALYELIDPIVRARCEDRGGEEPQSALSYLRGIVAAIRTAEIEEVEILKAHKVSAEHGGRPAALVRAVVRYNQSPSAHESITTWVRDRGVWYSTAPPRALLPRRVGAPVGR